MHEESFISGTHMKFSRSCSYGQNLDAPVSPLILSLPVLMKQFKGYNGFIQAGITAALPMKRIKRL